MDKPNCDNYSISIDIRSMEVCSSTKSKIIRNLTIFFTVVWAATTLRLVTKSEINLIINDTIVLLIWLICTGYFIYICFLRSIKDY